MSRDDHHEDIMSTTLIKQATPAALDASVLLRIIEEGYGPGAWHGANFKVALSDVTPEVAFWRPGPERHNIAEIALHHAFSVRSVCERLSGKASSKPFVLEGDDWFELSNESTLPWDRILEVVASEQRKLETTIAELGTGRLRPAPDVKPFDLVLGITCHGVYHAGQIQLIKRLRG
jgi:hypothetical protein